MLNWIFLLLVAGAVLTAAFTGTMPQVTAAGLSSAKNAVDLALGLVGQMALWLGFMRVLQEAGLMRTIARGLQPVMTRLFRDVPPDHPAMGAMVLNLAANVLGLGNAATPFGLKAMRELDRLNPHPGVSTNAMALFLAINTSGVAVLPLGAVAVRATLGSKDPAGIILPSLLATACSTALAIIVIKLLERRACYAPERFVEGGAVARAEASAATPEVAGLDQAQQAAAEKPPASGWRLALVLGAVAAVAVAMGRHVMTASATRGGFDVARGVLSDWLLPLLMLAIVLFGFGRQVRVYEAFIAGAKEGFQICVTIIPFLVAILVAIGMFRASGALEVLVAGLSYVSAPLGIPGEALPMALIRPLSGSGALAVMTDTMKASGPDSLVGYMVAVMNGSTETTFYVLAVYFGSVGVRAVRHTIVACLAADVAGMLAAAWWTRLFFG